MTIVDIMSYVTYNNNTALYNHIYIIYMLQYTIHYTSIIYIYISHIEHYTQTHIHTYMYIHRCIILYVF
jgi:hypothetical protein